MNLTRLKCLFLVSMLLAARVAAGDSARTEIPSGSGPRPWTHLRFANEPGDFQFAVVGDLTGGNRREVFQDALRKLNLLRPEFVLSVGDFIEGYSRDAAIVEEQWRSFDAMTAQLEMPFFHVAGNHDVTNPVQRAIWTGRLGPAYYHFVYRNALFLALDTEDVSAKGFGEVQAAFAARVLQENPQVRWTLVFMHKPLWAINGGRDWSPIEQLLQKRNFTVFAGHWHRYQKYERDGKRYIDMGPTGAGLKSEGPLTGAFDHVTWVTMTGAGPRIANLQVDGIWDENVVTEASAAILRPLYEGQAVRAEPVFTEEAAFAGGRTRLTVRNRAELPMSFTGRFWQHAVLRPSRHAFDVVIPARETRVFEIGLAANEPRPADDLEPVTLAWKAGYRPPGGRPLEVEDALDLRVIRVLPCARREAPVAIDGRLDEWPDLPFVCDRPGLVRVDPESYAGPLDCSFRFALQHDADYLYLAAAVTDDVIVRQLAGNPVKRDSIEVFIDARPDPARSAFMGADDPNAFLVIRMAPGTDPAAPLVAGRNRLPRGLQAACAHAAPGMVVEIAVPVSYLDEKQGVSWSRLRFNMAVNDFDDPERDVSAQLWWKPWWRTRESYPGSGTFGRKDPGKFKPRP